MLSPDEEDFLSKQPKQKFVTIYPFNPRLTTLATEIIDKVHSVVPELEVKHMGASALKISGQCDLDIYIFCDKADFSYYLPKLSSIFGPRDSKSIIEWNYTIDDFDVELYLTDPNSPSMKRQVKVYEILKNNPQLLQEYAVLKEKMDGKPYQEYQRKKYEFYHRILGETLTN